MLPDYYNYLSFVFLLLLNFYHANTRMMDGDGGDVIGKPWEKDLKIPKDIKPISYDVYLHPDMENGLFKGHVKILFNLTESRDWIPVHVKSTTIYKTTIFDSNEREIDVENAFEYSKHEFWIIQVPKLNSGLYKMELKFNGSLTQSIVGFYRSVYTENNKSR